MGDMYERRTFPIELRSDGTAISGHAAVTGQLSEEMGGFFGTWQERIAGGAFDEAVRRAMAGKDDVYALLNHDPNYVIASTADGSLRLSVDERGLFAEMTPMDTQTIRDLVVQPVREGKLRKMSFGFTVADEHDEKSDGVPIRVIDKIERLFDVSVVTFPAYPQTDVQANGLLARMGIDAAKMSAPEYVSFRSLIARHLPAAPSQEGRAAADRRVGAGAPIALLRRRLGLERDLYRISRYIDERTAA